MLDLKWVRENPEILKQIIFEKAGLDNEAPLIKKANVDEFLKLDIERANLITEIENINRARNEIAEALQDASKRTPERVQEAKELKEKLPTLEAGLKEIEAKWFEIQSWFPNIKHPDMPVGKGSEDNVEVKAWRPDTGFLSQDQLGKGEFSGKFMPEAVLHATGDFQMKSHVEIGEALGIIDTKQSAIVSGSRFCYILNDAARLQFALQQFMIEKLFSMGYEMMIPPVLVKERSLFGTSHFPGDADQVYQIENKYLEDPSQKLYLVGSSEPSNFSFFMDKVLPLNEKKSAYKYFATTHCFRSEVGSWGKDVKGIKRVHQFDKLELDVVCTPETSNAIHEELLSINEWLLQALKLPYHIINMCTGDAGYAATAKKYDIEVWLPTDKKYIEVGSNTNAFDYQARRMNIKLQDGRFAHTVNDTGIPFGRMLICIIENYQQADGSIKVPEVLVKYMGKEYITK